MMLHHRDLLPLSGFLAGPRLRTWMAAVPAIRKATPDLIVKVPPSGLRGRWGGRRTYVFRGPRARQPCWGVDDFSGWPVDRWEMVSSQRTKTGTHIYQTDV